MAKSRKQILQELLELENEKVEDLEEVDKKTDNDAVKNDILPEKTNSITPVEKVKKPRTQKQLEAFENAKSIRDANALKRKEEAQQLALELKKKEEVKIVKKAIALKKKELKKHKVLDEISDDESGEPLEVDDIKISKDKKPIPLEKHLTKGRVLEPKVASLEKPSIKISFY